MNKDQFLSLDSYRYKGEIFIPFDPMDINEGKYTDEGLDELINASIRPSCGLSSNDLKNFFDELKKDFRQTDGLILIKKDAKRRINALLTEHPSPLRNMEVMVDQMVNMRGDEIEREVDQMDVEKSTSDAVRQTSSFMQGSTTTVEAKAKEFEKIQKTKKRKDTIINDDKPKTELKRIRRSRKGFRG